MAEHILIVDDDPVQRRMLEEQTRRLGYTVSVAEGGPQALELVAAPGQKIDLIILDMIMPEMDGLMVMKRLREAGFDRPVIVGTVRGGIDTAVNAMRQGAFDFLVKPASQERLQVALAHALKVEALETEVRRLNKTALGTMTFKELVTKSSPMARVIRLGEKAAASTIPILIEGESGVGKEMIARAIQGTSDRRSKPFITVNCGALPPNLVESTLFGHEKGAFTGAADKHIGKFQEAHGGTLFLDEVGELPLETQVKLLRALQEGEVDPIGARRPVKVDFRLISATNRDMIQLVKDGKFREDLFYRLNVFPIRVPPLRERREDIAELARHFTARFAAEEGKRRLTGIGPAAIALLEDYDWPGNIRQMENAIFRAVVLCDGRELTAEDFPQIASQLSAPRALILISPEIVHEDPAIEAMRHDLDVDRLEAARQAADAAGASMQVAGPFFGFVRYLDDHGQMRPLAEVEKEMINLAIAHYGGRMAEVARRLGIGRSTLYRKLSEYGLDPNHQEGDTLMTAV